MLNSVPKKMGRPKGVKNGCGNKSLKPKGFMLMGNKGPLTPEYFEILLERLQGYLAKRRAVQQRYKGLDPYNRLRLTHKHSVVPFSHLPPQIRAIAERKWASYKEKHKVRLATLPPKRRAQLLGSLAAAASRWANSPEGECKGWGKRGFHLQNHVKALRTRLGLTPPSSQRAASVALQARIHELQGKEPEAEVGSANMDGI